MRSTHTARRLPVTLAASAAVVALLLTGCGQQQAAPQASPTPTQTSTSGADVDESVLLDANEQLAAQLGDEYVQGWIQDGKLHVAATSEAAVQAIEQAGAVGHLVDFSNAQLREGISQIMAWQAKQEPRLRSAIHAYTLNPRTGGLTLAVDASQRQAVQDALAKDKPAGAIPLDFTDSSGPASPAPATVGTPSS
ncbi:hypothetical protein [Glutamicibacter soli]